MSDTRIAKFCFVVILCLYICLVKGCSRSIAEVQPEDIYSPHPGFQVVAMQKVAEQENGSDLARFVELLASEDSAVRFYAILSLKKITGTDNGYDYRYNSVQRREAIERWKIWLREKGSQAEVKLSE